MGVIVFNGKSSLDYHVHVSEPPEYAIPEREYETVHVSGRSGDIIIDTGAYQNVDRTYKVSVDATSNAYSDIATSIVAWLHPVGSGTRGYYKLTDSYDPKYFRLARYQGGDSLSNILNKAGEMDITFNCKPYKYLISGENSQTVINGQTLSNPCKQVARPTITVSGSAGAVLTVGSRKVRLKATLSNLVIDSELETCYVGNNNQNSNVDLLDSSNNLIYEFPTLGVGNTQFTFSGITACRVVPNWCDL